MSLSLPSLVDGSCPAVQNHRGRSALCEAAPRVSVPALLLQKLGFALSVTAGQVHTTHHQHESPVTARSAGALAVARGGCV